MLVRLSKLQHFIGYTEHRNYLIRLVSLEDNIQYWTEHLDDDKDAKKELKRCTDLLQTLSKDITRIEDKLDINKEQ